MNQKYWYRTVMFLRLPIYLSQCKNGPGMASVASGSHLSCKKRSVNNNAINSICFSIHRFLPFIVVLLKVLWARSQKRATKSIWPWDHYILIHDFIFVHGRRMKTLGWKFFIGGLNSKDLPPHWLNYSLQKVTMAMWQKNCV